MADPSESDADATSAPPEGAEPAEPTGADPSPGARRRTLDRRTVAIAAILGVIAALATVLVASALSSDAGSDKGMVLEDAIDSQQVLSQPLEELDGEKTDLASLQEDGKPMLVNLWQSTCSPCVHEMPMLNEAQADNPDVSFIGIATQEPSLADAKALAKQTGITYPWVLDDMGGVFYESNGKGMPTTLLISASGTVIDTKSGAFADAKDLQAFIDQTE